MTTTTLAAARRPATRTELDLDARLAARDAAMTVQLQETGLGFDVNTAHIPTDLAEIVHLPVETLAPVDTEPGYATPVAALLKRAQRRILREGWSRDTARNQTGGMCLIETIQAEAHSHLEEGEARLLLHRALGGGDSIPALNRRLRGAGHAAVVLGQAAAFAAAEGI